MGLWKDEFWSIEKSSQDFASSADDCWVFSSFYLIPAFWVEAVSGFFFNIFPAFLPKCIFFLGLLYPASSAVPGIGPSLQKPFQEYLEAQRQKLHHKSETGAPQVRLSSILFSSPPPPQFQGEVTFTALTGIFRQIERGLSVLAEVWGSVYSLLANVPLSRSENVLITSILYIFSQKQALG